MPKKINISAINPENFLKRLEEPDVILKKDNVLNNYYLCEQFYCSRWDEDLRPVGLTIYSKRYQGNSFPPGNIFGDCGQYLRQLSDKEINHVFKMYFEKYKMKNYTGSISCKFHEGSACIFYKNKLLKDSHEKVASFHTWGHLASSYSFGDYDYIKNFCFENKFKEEDVHYELLMFKKYWYYDAEPFALKDHKDWLKRQK